jgi:hypothetical protein
MNSKTSNTPSQHQFFVPLTSHSESYPGFPKAEPVVVMSESEARRLVTAIDNCWPSDAIAIIQRQPWFREIRAGIRATRHLKPTDYIKLSYRTWEHLKSL